MKTWQQLGIDIRGKSSGTVKTKCPACQADRKKHTSDTPLTANISEGVFFCHHCGYKGSLKEAAKNYVRPTQSLTTLSNETKQWFEKRGIEENVLQYFKITESITWMPAGEFQGNPILSGKRKTINFNYFRDGELINVKYRDAKKTFLMVKDAEKIFYNLDAIKGKKECLICEGEIDAMSFYAAGYFYAISVPNGATKSEVQNLNYLDNSWELFEDKEKIYIATDQDEAGTFLQRELVRRLGADRCYIVNFEDVKDANEYLCTYGSSKLLKQIKEAQPIPTKGIWKAESFKEAYFNLFRFGRPKAPTVHLGNFDKLLTFRQGDFTIVSGIPSHGKTEFTLWLMVLLSSFYGWKWVVFCPENMPEEELCALIAGMFIGETFSTDNEQYKMKPENAELAFEFINEHFMFFKFDEADISVDGICDIFKECVKKYGVNGGLVDPWNRVEHLVPKGVSESTYIGQSLSKFTNLCKMFGMHIFFIAHPTKMKKDADTGQYEVPNLYSISGSAHFYNMTDNGIIIYRNPDNTVTAFVQKVKWKFNGAIGDATFNYHFFTGRYAERDRDYLLPYRYWLEFKNKGTVMTEEFEKLLEEETFTQQMENTNVDENGIPYPF